MVVIYSYSFFSLIVQIAEEISATRSGRNLFERWEDSLLSATSLSQVYLHLATLDKSIVWAKSTLETRCKLCRRKGDPDKMLLCDGCDRGHHMYCLKPPMDVSLLFFPLTMVIKSPISKDKDHLQQTILFSTNNLIRRHGG